MLLSLSRQGDRCSNPLIDVLDLPQLVVRCSGLLVAVALLSLGGSVWHDFVVSGLDNKLESVQVVNWVAVTVVVIVLTLPEQRGRGAVSGAFASGFSVARLYNVDS